MENRSKKNMWTEEETLKENVYSYFDRKLAESSEQIKRESKYVASGAYDDHHAFTAHNDLAEAKRKDNELKKRFLSLSAAPYFSHMTIRDEDDTFQVMLSDCEDLDIPINIDDNKQIVPFKQSTSAPMLSMLFHQYVIAKTGSFTVSVPGWRSGTTQESEYHVDLIRNVDVHNRVISNVVQLAPHTEGGIDLEAIDELLVQRLSENRANAKLSNIISTLQKEQFEIISTDIATDFVVQGCAGSGKTQCLIHRLFFLRDALGSRGWDKVLLITPSQLFRKYSMELMRRYHLANIANCSLANLYRALLNAYDPRFKSRQYLFELTEEYLPDEYLHRVYAPEQISKIEQEISRAVLSYIQEGCKLLEIDPADIRVSAEFIETIVKQLEDKIEEFDLRAQELSKSDEYREHINALESTDKQLHTLYKRQTTLEENWNTLQAEQDKLDSLKYEIQTAEAELVAWKASVKKETARRIEEYNKSVDAVSASSESCHWYRKALFQALDITLPSGKKYQLNQENTAFLEEMCQLAKEDLNLFLEGKTEKDWLHRYTDKRKTNANQRQKVLDDIDKLSSELEFHRNWIQEFSSSSESIENQRKTYRASLERARYFLSRIESSVFEQEVWNALQPLKEECGIQTVLVETLEDGRQKKTRILYKSDLLFYVKIYAMLHDNKDLPSYSLICIDEGQDLHSADYSILRKLFPKATLNIFGDTAQALHVACGISDWTAETGINKVFEINSNYRNTPATVDFCNKQFNRKMLSIGKILPEDAPIILNNPWDLRSAIAKGDCSVIVKSRKEFEEIRKISGLNEDAFDFLDMKAEAETTGKIHCYSIFAAKGLEFPRAVVYSKNMNMNQKTVACTRAMEQLYYYG